MLLQGSKVLLVEGYIFTGSLFQVTEQIFFVVKRYVQHVQVKVFEDVRRYLVQKGITAYDFFAFHGDSIYTNLLSPSVYRCHFGETQNNWQKTSGISKNTWLGSGITSPGLPPFIALIYTKTTKLL